MQLVRTTLWNTSTSWWRFGEDTATSGHAGKMVPCGTRTESTCGASWGRSRLLAEDMVGLQRASSPLHQDLSDALTNRYIENVQKLKLSDPSVTESHLVNIIIKAVMPDYFKGGVLTQDDISQAYFGTLFCSRKKRLGPMKKAHLKAWKFAW